jgi:hypothetical protein
LELQAQSRCIPGRPLLAPIYRWPGLDEPVGFDTDPSYMTVYNTTSLFDYDYTLTSTLGLLFYGILTEQTSRVIIQRASVVIPLSVAPKILSKSQIQVKSSNLRLTYNLRLEQIFDFLTCNVYQYFILTSLVLLMDREPVNCLSKYSLPTSNSSPCTRIWDLA